MILIDNSLKRRWSRADESPHFFSSLLAMVASSELPVMRWYMAATSFMVVSKWLLHRRTHAGRQQA